MKARRTWIHTAAVLASISWGYGCGGGTAAAADEGTSAPSSTSSPSASSPASASAPASPVAATPTPSATAEFNAQARVLWRAVACASSSAREPTGIDEALIASHCATMSEYYEGYRKKWLANATEFLRNVVPAKLPAEVVYPFGGGDLLTALATYPQARVITTMSLEPVGDPRGISTATPAAIKKSLALTEAHIKLLLRESHSRTDNMSEAIFDTLPGQLLFALVGLTLHDLEPVSLRYYHLDGKGEVTYVTTAEIAAADALPESERGAAMRKIFANMELAFRKVGAGPEAPTIIYRHLVANLDDEHLGKRPEVLAHLLAKGRVAAMTKAASFLLWWDNFSAIRDYLLAHMDFMVSDATGVPPEEARKAGFVQETYGTFAGPFLPDANRRVASLMMKMWAEQPQRPLAFRYGYPDNAHHGHLMITRPMNVGDAGGDEGATGGAR